MPTVTEAGITAWSGGGAGQGRREPWPGEAGPDEPDEAGRAELPAASARPAEPGGGDNVGAGPSGRLKKARPYHTTGTDAGI